MENTSYVDVVKKFGQVGSAATSHDFTVVSVLWSVLHRPLQSHGDKRNMAKDKQKVNVLQNLAHTEDAPVYLLQTYLRTNHMNNGNMNIFVWCLFLDSALLGRIHISSVSTSVGMSATAHYQHQHTWLPNCPCYSIGRKSQ